MDILRKLIEYLRSSSAKLAYRTFVIAFAGLFLPGLLGWLHDVSSWASTQGQAPFPSVVNLSYLLVTAVGAGFIAIVNLLINGIEHFTGKAVGRDVIKEE